MLIRIGDATRSPRQIAGPFRANLLHASAVLEHARLVQTKRAGDVLQNGIFTFSSSRRLGALIRRPVLRAAVEADQKQHSEGCLA
jgi:hypothetical protein